MDKPEPANTVSTRRRASRSSTMPNCRTLATNCSVAAVSSRRLLVMESRSISRSLVRRLIASTAAADRARSAQPAMASLMNLAKLPSSATSWASKAWARDEVIFSTPMTSLPRCSGTHTIDTTPTRRHASRSTRSSTALSSHTNVSPVRRASPDRPPVSCSGLPMFCCRFPDAHTSANPSAVVSSTTDPSAVGIRASACSATRRITTSGSAALRTAPSKAAPSFIGLRPSFVLAVYIRFR